jgi:hypothetical protein
MKPGNHPVHAVHQSTCPYGGEWCQFLQNPRVLRDEKGDGLQWHLSRRHPLLIEEGVSF